MKAKILLLAGCAALFVGCTNDPFDEGHVPVTGAPQIRVSGAIDQEYITRVDDGGFCGGDQIGLYGVNYTDDNATAGTLLDEGNQVDNARYTYNEESGKWEAAGSVYYKDAETHIDLYSYYPYAHPESTSAYAFEVMRDQTGEGVTDGYGMSDFLWAKAENVAPTEQNVSLRFSHRLACAQVVLAEGEGFAEGEFAGLSKSVLVMNTSRSATIDLSTGVATVAGEVEREGIVMKSGADGFKAIVVPQSVEAGAALFSITVDGITYRFKKEEGFTYEAGMQSKFTITIKKKSHSGELEFTLSDCDIIPWEADLEAHGGEAKQYYVVHLDEPGTLGEKIRAAKKNPDKIKNLKVSGKIDGREFQYMRDSMQLLQAINLKESKILASWYQVVYIGSIVSSNQRTIYIPGVMPATNSEREAIVKSMFPNQSVLLMTSDGYYGQLNDDELPYGAFQSKSYLTNFVFPEKVTKIGECAFAACGLLSGTITIPDDVTEVGKAAFSGCDNITSLLLPSRLEKIGASAFSGCSSLAGNLNIPTTVTYIGGDAFRNCSGFSGPLVLPENLTVLGSCAFTNCSGFTGSLTIPQSLKCVYAMTFTNCSGLNGQLVLHDDLKLSLDAYESSNSGGGIFNGCRFQGELKLPSNITTIPAGCFEGCQFSSIAGFPEGLLSIDAYAFRYNSRLMGVLEFPESLVSLGDQAFYDCRNIEGLILPNDLAVIKTSAFNGCYNVSKFICRSKEPPVVQSGAFGGISKVNFTLEVPESAINRYQTTLGWSDFKRIGAHHDFSISCRQMRVLNAQYSKKLIVRAPANYAWSVESAPEWVSVTPSSGVGRQEVEVTVAEMTDADVASFEINVGTYNNPKYETHQGRVGDVVFLLNDKEYRSKLTVEQYDCDNYDGEVIVNQSAEKGEGVNIVFMGDCFDARDIANGSYLTGINTAIEHYFAIEPYKHYRDYFNVYTVVGMSSDSGVGTVDNIKDAKFGSQYMSSGITPNFEAVFDYACRPTTVDSSNIAETLVVLITNTNEYGGVTHLWADGSAISICPMSDDAYPYDFRGIVQHEAGGHGFGKLGDESIVHNAFVTACGQCGDASQPIRQAHSRGWYQNLSLTGDMEKVCWSHFLFNPKYANIVDVYEGGYYHTRGVYRSEPNSCMNNNIPYFSAISRQAIVERIMKYAGQQFNINDFYANDVLDSQGNITGSTQLSVKENAVTLTGAGKQMAPKFMGQKPELR